MNSSHAVGSTFGRALRALALLLSLASIVSGCFYESYRREPGPPPRYPHDVRQDGPPRVPEMVIIPTRMRNARYIVDTRRRLCFFQYIRYGRPLMVMVDCRRLPEAGRIFAKVGPQGPTNPNQPGPNDPNQPPNGPDSPPTPEGPAPHVPAPTMPPTPPTPDLSPKGPDIPSPAPRPEPKLTLSSKDLDAVRKLYPEVVCLSRQGKLTEEVLKARLQTLGLTVESYRRAIDKLSADKDSWQKLTKEALKRCGK